MVNVMHASVADLGRLGARAPLLVTSRNTEDFYVLIQNTLYKAH